MSDEYGPDLGLPGLQELPTSWLLHPLPEFPDPPVGQSSRLLPLLELGGGHFESFGLDPLVQDEVGEVDRVRVDGHLDLARFAAVREYSTRVVSPNRDWRSVLNV